MSLGNTVEFAHVTLGLVPETLDTVDVFVTICEQLGMVYSEVMETLHIQHIVATSTVGIDNAVWHNFAFDNQQ